MTASLEAVPDDTIAFDVVGCGVAIVDFVRYAGEAAGRPQLTQWGGPAGNTLSLLAAFGLRTALIGAIGGDESGQFVRGAMRAFGVDDSLLVVQREAQTPSVSMQIVVKSASAATDSIRCLGVRPSRGRANLSPGDLRDAHFDVVGRCRVAHFDYANEAMLALAGTARRQGIVVSFDLPRFRPAIAGDVASMIGLSDLVFTTGAIERRYLDALGTSDFFRLNPRLRMLVVTRGGRGAVGRAGPLHGKRCWRVEAVRPRHFCDSLGAGDAFIATVLRALVCERLLETDDPRSWAECLAQAARVASRACEHWGAKGLISYLGGRPPDQVCALLLD